ncbi:hypothetical protein BDB00DRAFT_860834 [Zychaea mexicana]|uniref:uncharacterized protein n=1 Tax=Zychaea mexicana TaxID=64656 RepID=UPI0022FDFAAC|nr:uncharacterized protein BDB00DRAFT_860834 [Zychaea mexicana]KAI9472955.1 hypothetical protein BDB00DRAFT_860834 [Zychaea mexicana]
MLCMFHHADVPSDTVAAYFGKKCQCTHPASASNTGLLSFALADQISTSDNVDFVRPMEYSAESC